MGRKPEPPSSESVEEVLTEALSPVEIRVDSALAKAAERSIRTDIDLDLEAVPDEELLYHDTASTARQAYVVSLLRLCRFLRRHPADFGQEAVQAKIAQAHVRHVESAQLAALQIGRSRADEVLDQAVAEARAELDALAAKKARLFQYADATPKS